MDHARAAEIWRVLGETQLMELRMDLVRAAIKYSNCRVEWNLARHEQRGEMGPARTRAHNAFIDACNILSRNMAKAGEANEWRSLLGDDRKEIGDFACFVVLFLGLAAR